MTQNPSQNKPIVGAQLYTCRDYAKTIPEISETLRKVAEIGYTAVQVSGFGPVDSKELAKVLSDSGLTVAGTHVGWDRFLTDIDALIEEHREWGCRHPAIGGLPGEYFSEEGLTRFLDEVQEVGARLGAAGMDFSYHNHHHELTRYSGRTWLDRLYSDSDPACVKAEIDTYWIQAGGGDPVQWIRRCAGREPLLHLKDMAMGPDKKARMAEIGEGNLNWPAILQAAEEGGVEYLLVEQDECYERTPFESLAISYEHLKEWGYR